MVLYMQQEKKKSGNLVAIKKVIDVFGDSKELKRTLREIKLLKYFSEYGQIIGAKDLLIIQENERNVLYIVMELMEQDLHQFLLENENVPPNQVKNFMFQILCGIKDIHEAKVIHRDIRPRNLLTRGNTIKITDFGMGRAHGLRMSILDLTTTRWYRAPEGFFNWTNYSGAVDIWSVGCIFVEMLGHAHFLKGKTDLEQLEMLLTIFGQPPEDMTRDSVISKAQKNLLQKFSGKLAVPLTTLLSNIDPLAMDLIEKMLTMDPQSRVTAAMALEHPYFKGCTLPDPPVPKEFPSNINCENMTSEEMIEEMKREVNDYHNKKE